MQSHYLGGRYRVISLLGGGGMGTVFLVRDLATGGEIALKRLKQEFTGSSENVRFLETEFKSLATFNHPNLVRVYDFHVDAQIGAYFTMEYVNGVTIQEYLTPLDHDKLYRVVHQVCSALEYVHGRGFIHGDIKISNILIAADAQGEPLAKLLDFGLVRNAGPETSGIWGTTRTMAPEIIRGSTADARSDLYSLGVVLYTITSGYPPFSDSDPLKILAQHLTVTPPSPRRLNAALDPDLERIVMRLLEKEPARRYYSAYDLSLVFSEKAGIKPDQHQVYARINSPNHIGRADELLRLVEAFRQLNKGKGQVIAVTGEAGSGKSRLLREFKLTVQLCGGDCYLVSCKDLPKTAFEPLQQLYSLATGVADAWPQLAEVGSWREDWQQTAMINRLAELWNERARQRPAVLIVEDLQEADNGTLMFILTYAEILRENDIPLLIVASSRIEQLAANHPLIKFAMRGEGDSKSQLIELRGLSESNLHLFLVDILGQSDLPAEFERYLYRETDGNPADTIEIINSLVDAGILQRLGQRWVIKSGQCTWTDRIVKLNEIGMSRIKQLPPEEQELLRQASTLGERFTGEALINFSGLSPEVVRSLLLRLVRAGILVREENTFLFARPSTRKAIYDGLSRDEKIEFHHKALDMITDEEDDASTLFLAEHVCTLIELDDFENLADEANFLYRASNVAVKNLLLPTAQRYLECATKAVNRIDLKMLPVDLLYRIRSARLQLALQVGDPQIAAADFADFDDLVQLMEPHQRVELLSLRAALAINTGAIDEADRWVQQARRLLSKFENPALNAYITLQTGEISKVRGNLQQALTMYKDAYDIFAQMGNTARIAECSTNIGRILFWIGEQDKSIEYLDQARLTYQQMHDPVGECRTLLNLGVAYTHKNDCVTALSYFKQTLTMARKIGNRRYEGASLLNAGNVCTQSGDFDGAAGYFQESLEVHRLLNNRLALTLTLINIGYLKASLGAFDTAKQCLESAMRVAEQDGFKREASLARLYLGGVYFLSGDTKRSLALLLESLQLQEQLDDILGTAEIHNWLSRVYRHPSLVDLKSSLTHAARALDLSHRHGHIGGVAHALSNLAATQLAMNDLKAANESSAAAVKTIERQVFIEGFKEEIYFIRYRVLNESGHQEEAARFLQEAHNELQAKADRIHDPQAREQFITSLPLHRRIYEAVNERPDLIAEGDAELINRLIVFEPEMPTARLSAEEIAQVEVQLLGNSPENRPKEPPK